jgi:hypothetical protein
MNKRLFTSLSILAFAFALVLGFGAINYSNANDLIPDSYPGQVNLFGDDRADIQAGVLTADKDAAVKALPESYGLQGARVSTF